MRALLFVVALLIAPAMLAQVDTPKPEIVLSAEQEALYKELLPDLRCLVCQNESLADSTAPLAQDLKYEVRGLVAKGRGEAEIKKYLTDRYGDFVLFKPPFDPRTALLWIGPFVLALLGALIAVLNLRRRAPAPAAPPAVDREALQRLLDKSE
jgi:cytochrome c-type biogenesis protein CcmH